MKDNRLSGFKLSELAHLRTNLTVDYFFIELGVEGKLSDYAVKDLKKSIKCAFWEQLIYYFELTDSQDSIYNQLLYQLPAFNPKNYKTSSQKSDLIVAHLTDEDRGLRFLFEREWPSLLFLNGIDGIAHENRMLMFARQLQNKGIEHIALGNLSTAAIKKLDFS
ncbi:MAG: hypothetical protein GWN16_03695 [Calditrichae bacterium]|nr:hypothetical protein [Calditrichia bacterium]